MLRREGGSWHLFLVQLEVLLEGVNQCQDPWVPRHQEQWLQQSYSVTEDTVALVLQKLCLFYEKPGPSLDSLLSVPHLPTARVAHIAKGIGGAATRSRLSILCIP